MRKNRKLQLKIPAGVDDGSRIRLSGEGDAGTRGGPRGDLYVFISVTPHELFERDNLDLLVTVPVPMTTAALGGEIEALLAGPDGRPLAGRRAVVTAGPTFEPIDPVRGLTNRSSGKQGYAIAEALARLGAQVTLVSGPVALAAPVGVERLWVETAREMQAAVTSALPADIAVMSAAVADWRVDGVASGKIKKAPGGPPSLSLIENPDILAGISAPGKKRPKLVVGFAAETTDLEVNARSKLSRKGCDWIVGNDVSDDVFGADGNTVTLFTRDGTAETWPRQSKAEVARKLAARIADHFRS